MSPADDLQRIRAALNQVIHGKAAVLELLLTGVIAAGHVLIEDVPGVGKTTLGKALARLFATAFTRVQFTPDLLPADILGSQLLDPREGSFSFQRGPIFTNLLLADEINRASPRTQSALLEAMNEGQATVDGVTHKLPQPFFVLATQNPSGAAGTYPLPDAQLDRFLLRIAVGYPDEDAELRMLYSHRLHDPLEDLQPVITPERLLQMQGAARAIEVREPVARYLLQIVAATRATADIELGVSPRGSLALLRASQARALMAGRDYVSPADIQTLCVPVLAHRLQLTPHARYSGQGPEALLTGIVRDLPVPT